ncbi:MAG: hypothetical protein AB8V19_05175 [Candidatus Midichloria sp.]|uniref:Uncharacterized protein n=1 Tax=Hyalomma marginatum TaxID=34627 RepID=A0A8S4C320_9ACAR|nr:hypothetical protein MHYMCMPASI_01080 [Hyalomma marginatum]
MQRQSEPQALVGLRILLRNINYCPKRNHSNMFCRSSSSNTDNKTANELVEDKLQNKD